MYFDLALVTLSKQANVSIYISKKRVEGISGQAKFQAEKWRGNRKQSAIQLMYFVLVPLKNEKKKSFDFLFEPANGRRWEEVIHELLLGFNLSTDSNLFTQDRSSENQTSTGAAVDVCSLEAAKLNIKTTEYNTNS